jgi:TolB-like protein
MAEAHLDRRMLAILAADVVGYARLMEVDEAGTIARLRAIRAEIADLLIAEHKGRIVKLMGDGALLVFDSVVGAVQCAIDIQRALAARNAALPAAERIVFRIGINLGDVALVDGDVYGDSVNVASRVEQLCAPGEVALSGTVHDHLHGKLAIPVEFAGEHIVKNLARPIRVYRIAPLADGEPVQATVMALPEKPSLAVLPFENIGGDPSEGYFADGMVEEIITALARISDLFVIARNSSFVYRGRAVEARQIGRELGVRYLMEGSVRRAADRVRITAQLIEAATGVHLWADRFDGSLADVFDLQDRVAEAVAGVIEPALRRAEIARARRKPTDSLDAYDLYLRSLPHALAMTPEDNGLAVALLDRALALDPNYAVASALKSWCHQQRILRPWLGFELETEHRIAVAAARHALVVGRDDPTALAIAGFVVSVLTGDHGAAIEALRRALTLNPNSALALGFMALVHCFTGDYAMAMSDAERAIRLSPLDPLIPIPLVALAYAALFTGRPDQALAHATRAIQANPAYDVPHAQAVAALVYLGRLDEARYAASRMQAAFPAVSIARRRRAAFRDAAKFEAYLTALASAGLPP